MLFSYFLDKKKGIPLIKVRWFISMIPTDDRERVKRAVLEGKPTFHRISMIYA